MVAIFYFNRRPPNQDHPNALSVLQTEADVLGTSYDRTLNFIIGIVGTALVVGQLVDNHIAALLYQTFASLVGTQSVWLPLPPLTEANKILILAGVRGTSICLFMLIAYLSISLYLRLARK